MDNSRPSCQPRARCRRWRECPECARIRQARIANACERLQYITPKISWATIQPIEAGEAALLDARAEFLAKVRPRGAVWTVEQAPTTGRLHCNVLLPAFEPRRLNLAASHVIEAITNPRRVGAYISKREQMPDKANFGGRLYGTAGPLWQWLTSGDGPPLVNAAAIQADIDREAGQELPRQPAPPPPQGQVLTLEDYAEIARRRLPDVWAGKNRAESLARPIYTVD